ncbi:MAG: SprT-like domain-containing protein [Verrucomicrobiota bacterium]
MTKSGFRGDQLVAWRSLLVREWEKANQLLISNGHPSMDLPNFSIHPAVDGRWGCWQKGRRLIEVSERLLREYSRADVIETLRHEMAHQFVSEVLNFDEVEPPHGPSFQAICEVLGCDARASCGAHEMTRKEEEEEHSMIGRIRKLWAHGQCESISRKESEVFLSKARELMVQYQVEQWQIEELEDGSAARVYVQRPIGPLFSRMPAYYHQLGNILSNYYEVNYIQVYHEVLDAEERQWKTGLEVFGERSAVDVAEFVGHQLMMQGDSFWQVERRLLTQKNKRSFLSGLFSEYAERLEREKEEEESRLPRETLAIIALTRKELDERYQEAYPGRRRKALRGVAINESLQAGRNAAKHLKIREGLEPTSRPALPE